MTINISKHDCELTIAFDYSQQRIAKVKSIKGHKWNANEKIWTISFTEENLVILKELFKNEQKNIDVENNSRNKELCRPMEEEIKLKGYSFKTKKSYTSHVNQAISAIRFLCNEVLKRNKIIELMSRPKKENKLPNVLSFQDVTKILLSLKNEKHKTILFLTYSAGLRVGGVIKLQSQDIDSQRMLIHVVQGKGKKDRYTVLSEIALKQLRKYYKL